MSDLHNQCPYCQIETAPHPETGEAALSPTLTLALVAIPILLWASLVVAGGMLFGPPVLAALTLQSIALLALVQTASRRRPPQPRRDRPRLAVGLD